MSACVMHGVATARGIVCRQEPGFAHIIFSFDVHFDFPFDNLVSD